MVAVSRKSKKRISRNNSTSKTGTKKSASHPAPSQTQILKRIQKAENQMEMSNLLHEFIDSGKISTAEFADYVAQIKPLASQGKSGSVVGTLPHMPDSIIKMYKYKINPVNLIKINGKCIRIDNKLNELLINIIIKYLPQLFNLKPDEVRILKRNTLMITHHGISDDGSFIILPKIGISSREGKYITNLRELIEFNHHPILVDILSGGDEKKQDREDILAEYDLFIKEKMVNYIEVLKLFQRKLKYINTDVKMTNIFIKPIPGGGNSSNARYKRLRDRGFIVDFEMVLADLEKSSYFLGKDSGMVITTFPRSPAKLSVLYLIGHALDNNIRYGCDKTLKNTVCNNKLDTMDYDPVCLIIDFYAYMLRIDPRMIELLPGIYGVMVDILGSDKITTLVKILKNGKYKIDKRYSFVINGIISKYCKMV